MKLLLGSLIFLLSVSSFAATLKCRVDLYNSGSSIETLEKADVKVVDAINARQVLMSSDKRFSFEIVGSYYEQNSSIPMGLTVHITDSKNNSKNSFSATFEKAKNHFRFDGGDLDNGQSYVGICSLKL